MNELKTIGNIKNTIQIKENECELIYENTAVF